MMLATSLDLSKGFISYEIVCITKHLLSAYNVSERELSRDHMFFS